MKAKNLRIGNLVGIKKTSLHADGCNTENAYFEIEELKKDVVHFKGFHAGEYYKDLEPIKLNDGLLSLYGFKRYPWGLVKDGLLFNDNLDCKKLIFRIGNGSETTLIYVHELQNLFFALTGAELEMNIERSTCG